MSLSSLKVHVSFTSLIWGVQLYALAFLYSEKNFCLLDWHLFVQSKIVENWEKFFVYSDHTSILEILLNIAKLPTLINKFSKKIKNNFNADKD